MKETKLRIGNKGEGKHVKIPFSEPETLQEFRELFGDNEGFLVGSAMRGVRIRIQDLTRDTVAEGLKAGKSTEAVASEVLDLLSTIDITEKKERKAPVRKPVEVALPEGKTTFSKDELQALLAAHGVKIAGQPVEGAPTPA
jgi:hypothetical protein